MLDVFEKLSKKSRAWGTRSGCEWAWISLELPDVPDGPPRYTGIVLIDGRQVGDLIGNGPREFRLPPGEHRIVVRLGREARLPGYPGRGIASAQIRLEPGERVALVCGMDSLAAEEWGQSWRLGRRCHLALILVAWLAGGLGWLFFPVMQPAAVEILGRLGAGRTLAALINSPIRFGWTIGILALLMMQLLGGMLLWAWEREVVRRLQDRVGQPYWVGPRMAGKVTEEDWLDG